MNHWSVVCFACALAPVVPALRAADDDPVRAKLDKAEVAYKADMEKYRAAVATFFDKQEQAARRDGDKKSVDQVKAERKAFDEKGELPKSAPVALKHQYPLTARSSLEAAYIAAIREYTKSNHDDEANAVEKKLDEFRNGGGRPGPPSMFMDTGGQARRVCYIIDRSGSMAVAFDYVRRELSESIQDLENEHLFHVIFFNAAEPIEAAQRKFIQASDIHKVETIKFIATIVPTGRTDPRPAFRRAFALSPKPDLIYFLTDGAFDPDLLADLRRFNPDRKTRINTIALRSRAAEELLEQIARENGGTCVFVNPGAQAGENP